MTTYPSKVINPVEVTVTSSVAVTDTTIVVVTALNSNIDAQVTVTPLAKKIDFQVIVNLIDSNIDSNATVTPTQDSSFATKDVVTTSNPGNHSQYLFILYSNLKKWMDRLKRIYF